MPCAIRGDDLGADTGGGDGAAAARGGVGGARDGAAHSEAVHWGRAKLLD